MTGRLGGGSLARFALARGVSLAVTATARLSQLAGEVLREVPAADARVSQVVVEVLGVVVPHDRFRATLV